MIWKCVFLTYFFTKFVTDLFSSSSSLFSCFFSIFFISTPLALRSAKGSSKNPLGITEFAPASTINCSAIKRNSNLLHHYHAFSNRNSCKLCKLICHGYIKECSKVLKIHDISRMASTTNIHLHSTRYSSDSKCYTTITYKDRNWPVYSSVALPRGILVGGGCRSGAESKS